MDLQLQRILLPTDFSEYSAAATRYACELAVQFEAELHLLHVLEIHANLTPGFGMGLAVPGHTHESRTAAEAAFDRVLPAGWEAGRPVVRAVVEGTPFVEIIRYAREHGIDLLVISTHGRTGLTHVLLGSVAEKIVRKAPCPVLTVRPSGHQFVMP